MYPDPAALVQTRMSDLRREADAQRRALRVKDASTCTERPRHTFAVPAFLTFARVRHA